MPHLSAEAEALWRHAVTSFTQESIPRPEATGLGSTPLEMAIPVSPSEDEPLTIDTLRKGLAESERLGLLDDDELDSVRSMVSVIEASDDPRPLLSQFNVRYVEYGVGFVQLVWPSADDRIN